MLSMFQLSKHTTHMGQLMQGGENGCLMSFFYGTRVRSLVMLITQSLTNLIPRWTAGALSAPSVSSNILFYEIFIDITLVHRLFQTHDVVEDRRQHLLFPLLNIPYLIASTSNIPEWLYFSSEGYHTNWLFLFSQVTTVSNLCSSCSLQIFHKLLRLDPGSEAQIICFVWYSQ